MPALPHADSRAEASQRAAWVGWPSRVHRVAAALLIMSVCGLELRAVLGPHEDWPFTSAPMFARYQTPDDPVFELSFYVEDPIGTTLELDPQAHLGTGELGFRRHFFARYYGSTDERHPSGHFPRDGRAAFRERLAAWMKLVVAAYVKKRGHAPDRIWLEASKLSAGRVDERRPLFEFIPKTGRFRELPHTTWAEGP